ncbi:MAG: 1-deoxy-D-xylulose-5-phosphate synthase [Spirochaetales bacterium]|nr:1-deoxy-D-xylulose-5-phosphate synthase [Spirochaetales bacterium]MBQ7508491.1 1-deoxy-D-xylulose-5-phosphate synthase [Spirochaetales bacterium]
MRDTSDIGNMRDALMAAIIDLAREHKEVVFLDADLSSCINSVPFQKEFPDRFFNCGIAEANMVGVAAGLSSMGFVPYAHSFGCFSSRRTYDQFYLSVNYAGQRVHLIGTDAGVTAQINGGTHMPLEDVGLMRLIPDLIVLDPSDAQSCYDLTVQAYESGHSSYTRLRRKGVTHRYAPGQVKLGKGNILAEGKDLAIIASDEVIVNEAEKAVALLKTKGISATLVDMHTVKPLDTELIEKLSAQTGRILVCENARYAGGLGEAVAAHLAKTCPAKMDFVCVGEKFGEVGKLDYLLKAFNLTAEDIAAKAEALAKR